VRIDTAARAAPAACTSSSDIDQFIQAYLMQSSGAAAGKAGRA